MTTALQKRIAQDEAELEAMIKAAEAANDSTDPETSTGDETEETEDQPVETKAAPKEDETDSDGTDWKKRYSDLRSHTSAKEKEFKEQLEELRAQLEEVKGSKPVEIPESRKELEEWRTKNPNAARIIEAFIQEEAEKLFKETQLDVEAIKSDRQKLRKEQVAAAIKKEHPDFDEVKADDKFHDWVEKQPKWMQDAIYENNDDPDSIIRLLTLYKFETGKQKKKPVESAADAVSVKGGKPSADPEAGKKRIIKESWVEGLSATEFAKYEDEIAEAQAEGRFIYDMTKKR